MKEIFGLCSTFVDCAFFIHVSEFFIRNFFVQFFIEFPNHPIDFSVCHLDVHFGKDIADLFFCEKLSVVRTGQKFENLDQVFLFCLVDIVFLKLLFNSFLFFGFALFNFLNIKIVFLALSDIFFLKQNRVLVLALEMRWEVFKLDVFFCGLCFHNFSLA